MQPRMVSTKSGYPSYLPESEMQIAVMEPGTEGYEREQRMTDRTELYHALMKETEEIERDVELRNAYKRGYEDGRAEREKLLDELDRIMREEEINNERTGYESFVWVIHEVIPRLRQEGKQ